MNIYESISAIMRDCPAIAKKQKNQQQGFLYRGVDIVMNVLQPLLIQHKVFVVPEVISETRETRQTQKGGSLTYTILKMRYTFFAEDGTSIAAVVIGEAMDSADKSSNKAMSVAFKYACFQVFCIPTEEMHDPDAQAPQPVQQQAQNYVAEQPPIKCEKCGKNVVAFENHAPHTVAARNKRKHGQVLCMTCATEREKADGTDA